MSATPNEVFPILAETSKKLSIPFCEMVKKEFGFTLQPYSRIGYYNLLRATSQHKYKLTDVDFIEDLPKLINESFTRFDTSGTNIRPKWLVFVSSIKRGEHLLSEIERLCNGITAVFINSETKDSKINCNMFYDTVFNSGFKYDVLIAKTVLDNGVNITNPPVTDLAIDVFDETTTVQCAGRVRANENVPVINLYLQKYKPSLVNESLSYCKKILNLFEENRKRKLTLEQIERRNLPKIWYKDQLGFPKLNNFAEVKAINTLSFFEKCNINIATDQLYFLKKQCEWLEIDPSVVATAIDEKQMQILSFLKQYKNITLEASPEKDKSTIDPNNPVLFYNFAQKFKSLYLSLYGKRYSGEKTRDYGLSVIKKCLIKIGISHIVQINNHAPQKTHQQVTTYTVDFIYDDGDKY